MSRNLKNIGVVASATMASRVLGLGRDMLLSAVIGTSALASAFVTAFTLPNLFRRLLGEGSLTAALVPTLQEEIRRGQREAAFRVISQVMSWQLVVTGALTLLAVVVFSTAPALLERAVASGLDPAVAARWEAGADLAGILFPYVIFVCLAAAFSALLQTLGRFLEASLSPIWLNVSILVLLSGGAYLGWASSEAGRMSWLCGGVLLGGFLQMAVPAAALMREGWRPRFDLAWSAPLRQITRLIVPTLVGSAVYLVNMAVSRLVGLSLNDAAATLLNLATRIMELPIGVFAVAVTTVVFPAISRLAAEGDLEGLAAAYRKGMRLILAINVPAAAGMAVLSEPIVRVLFERGRFTAEDTAAMVPVLAVSALGLPVFSFVNLALRGFYARKDTRTPVRAAVLSFGVNLGLSLLLMRPLGTVGLVLAGHAAILAQAWYLQRHLAAAHDGLAFRHLWRDAFRILGASVGMAAAVAAGWWGLKSLGGDTQAVCLLALGLLVPSGVAVYAVALFHSGVEGREDLETEGRRLVAKLLRRRGSA